MGQDWKTLAVVLLGAALAGWLMVRGLGGARRAEPPPVAVAIATVPPPATSDDVPPEPATAKAPAAPALPPSADVPAAPAGDEAALIERDLGVLAGGLVRDQRIEDRVMPRINDILDVPGVISYRRAPDFWEPAFTGGEGMNR